MENTELVTVFTVSNPVQAEIIKNYLQSEGIRCFLEGENQAAEPGLIGLEIKLLTPAQDADRAGRLIAQHETHRHKTHSHEPPQRG